MGKHEILVIFPKVWHATFTSRFRQIIIYGNSYNVRASRVKETTQKSVRESFAGAKYYDEEKTEVCVFFSSSNKKETRQQRKRERKPKYCAQSYWCVIFNGIVTQLVRSP